MSRRPRPPAVAARADAKAASPNADSAAVHVPATAEQLARLHDMMFEQAAVPLALIDTHHRFVRVNSIWAGHHGKTPGEFVGRRYADLFPDQAAHIEKRARLLDQAIASKKPLRLLGQPYEFPDQPARGPTWWDWAISPLCNERGEVELVMFASVDATERVQAERQIALLSVAVDNVREAAYLIDPGDGTFRYVNDEACRMLGYTRAELVGMRPEDIDPTYAQVVAANPHHRELMAKVTHFETRHRTRDGRLIPVEISFNRFQHEGRTFNMALVRDISEHKRAHAALQRTNRALKTLSSCNEALVRAETEPELLNDTCRVLVGTGGYRQAWIAFAEHDDARTVRPVAWAGAGSDKVPAVRISWADTGTNSHPAGSAILTGNVHVIHDIASDPAFARGRTEALRHGLCACIAIPLRFGGEVIGALCLFSDDTAAFDRDEVALLLELGDDLSYGIHALRTRSEKERGLIRLQSTMEATIQALANTVELRDPYTAGHQQRVAQLVEAIARRLQLPSDRILGLRLAAAVHDVGKIFIPAEILSRPGKLSPIEYQMVQTHVDAGYDILRGIDFPWPIADMVRQHHERLDGSGYPQQLTGDAILFDARILAVADVVEAMSTHRPYRPGLGTDAALAEIAAGRATRFDAQVVDACVALLRDGEFRFD